MTAILVRLRSELRSRWQTWLSITLMLGLFGGAVLTIAAGARRTDTAYPRFLRWSNAFDVAVPNFRVPPSQGKRVFGSVSLKEVEHLPQVVGSSRVRIYETNGELGGNAPLDDRTYRTIQRAKVLQGRIPAADATNEAAVNWLQAQSLHLRVGNTFRMPFLRRDGSVDRVPLKIVGIEAVAQDFPPQLGNTPAFILSRGFDRKYHSTLRGLEAAALVLRHGFADIPDVIDEVNNLSHHHLLFILRQDTQAANVERSFHLQAVALWLLAGLTALVTLLMFGQTIARQTFLDSSENPTLSSLGMSRSQLLAVALLRTVAVALVGAATAVLIAVLASPLFPAGLARVAEPHPGFRFDPVTLGLGALAIVVVTGLLSAIPAWRAATRTEALERNTGERPSAVAATVARTGMPASGTTGVRLALERGRGRAAVPVRTAIAGVTVGIAALSAALTFGASLTHLLGTPPLYGVTWNVEVYANQNYPTKQVEGQLLAAARSTPGVAAYSLGTTGITFSVNGVAADAILLYHHPGGVQPPLIAGRTPTAPRELVLGPKTLEETGKHIGDTVEVGVFGTKPKPMRIVGEAVTPPIGDVGRFGKGAYADYDAAQYLVPGAPAADSVLVRTRPGVDPLAVGHAIGAKVHGVLNVEVSPPPKPNDLVNFGRVQNFPLYLAALVALMAAATLAHVLMTSIRRRRRDLAILKTIGFQRGQLTWTVGWQATTLTLVALALGIPIGIAVGRWIWTAFSNQLGILPSPAVPLRALLLAVPVTLLLANLIAYLPGRAAGRVQAATVLRTE